MEFNKLKVFFFIILIHGCMGWNGGRRRRGGWQKPTKPSSTEHPKTEPFGKAWWMIENQQSKRSKVNSHLDDWVFGSHLRDLEQSRVDLERDFRKLRKEIPPLSDLNLPERKRKGTIESLTYDINSLRGNISGKEKYENVLREENEYEQDFNEHKEKLNPDNKRLLADFFSNVINNGLKLHERSAKQ